MSEREIEELLSVVRGLILEVMEEDEAEVTVALETLFQDDLELESIELIALGDLLLARYGDSLDFAGWLTQLSLDELAELKVGDLVSWLHRELSEQR